ncbi:MAG: hypothetical protein MUF75_03355 [Bacteroidia bacterium]|nr:hypothetical protein [Bacteroidia bacterium]
MNILSVKKSIQSFISPDGSINGFHMQSNWFPQINADIFVSHSHRDEKTATALAGWLSDKFGISTFVDSCIWGYSNELLRQIDNKYCLNPGAATYSYEKRNHSTSHVHMMLSTALNMMIDKTECVLFLNTPNSITTKEVVSQTESPWLYSEISMSELVRKKKLLEYRPAMTRMFAKGGAINESLKVKYDVYLGHLTEIHADTLNNWESEWNKIPRETQYALDLLYELNTSIL